MSELGDLYRDFYFWLDHLPPAEKAKVSAKWLEFSPKGNEPPEQARREWMSWCEEKGFRRS